MIIVTKEFTFDAAHQLMYHDGKCANVHGHTYRLEVALKGNPILTKNVSDEGFVLDFTHLKTIVKSIIVDKMDHAFLACGNEPILPTLLQTNSKVVRLGFRTTVENMAQFICWKLIKLGLPVYYVRMWETPTGSAKVEAADLEAAGGPKYNTIGGCDLE